MKERMRRGILLILMILTGSYLKGQEQDLNNNHIGITLLPVYTECYRKSNKSFKKDNRINGEYGFNIGFKYLRFINKKYQLESGVNYSKIYVYLTEEIKLDNEYISRTEQHNILSFPVGIQRSFRGGFFLSVGSHINLELNEWTYLEVDSQDGIGFYVSAGKAFRISENIYIGISPIVKVYSVIAFKDKADNQNLIDFGIRMDLSYGFLR